MRHIEETFSGAAGVEIFWQAWLPERARAAVVVAHGASEHGGRYRRLAERLVRDDLAVYAVDHRGHGRSGGPRALIDRIAHATADLDRVVDIAAERHSGAPFLFGHSMGGAIAVEYAISRQAKLRALALSAPLAALQAAPAWQRALARVLSVAAPRLPMIAIDAGAVSRDADEVRAYEADPLNHHGKLPVRTVAELSAAVGSFPDRVQAITVALLLLHGTADTLVPITASEMLDVRSGSSDRTFLRYDGFFHELINEPPADRARVLEDIAAWLAAH